MENEKLRRQVEAHPYPLVFTTVSGAHLYGFPSPDSDYGLRGVHLLPLKEVVGLDAGRETVEKIGVEDGIEIDLVTHDAGTRGTRQDCCPMHHPVPRTPLPWLRRNTVEAIPEGKPATGQAAAVRVPSPADRHPLDEDR